MSNSISNYKELKQKIQELQAEKTKQEELIKQHSKELLDSLNPVNIIKRTMSHLAHDKEFRSDAFSAALNAVSGFLIKKIFRSDKSVKGNFFSRLAERLSASYINGHTGAIKGFVKKVIVSFVE